MTIYAIIRTRKVEISMNRFYFLNEIDDLYVTPIENSFINHYMPNARGDYVKVYLYGLKCCSNNTLAPTNSQIASSLKLTETDVINAWKYWENEGIVNIIADEADQIIEYKNITSILFLNGKNNQKSKIKTPSRPKIEQMFKDIEEKLSRPLAHREKDKILYWLEEYKFTPQTAVLLINDCVDREKRDIAYWEAVALSFYDNGIRTVDQGISYLKSRESRWKEYKEILNYLGFYRTPTKPERIYIDKWFDEYAFSLETILKACDETANTARPSFKYIDHILTAWHNNTTPEPFAGNKTQSKKKGDLDHDYDIKQIEDILFGD